MRIGLTPIKVISKKDSDISWACIIIILLHCSAMPEPIRQLAAYMLVLRSFYEGEFTDVVG